MGTGWAAGGAPGGRRRLGEVLVARLRQSAADGLPVLVMSASDDRHTRDRAAAAGATGFIPKPIIEPQLRAEVAAVLQRRPALVDHPA